MKLIDKYIFKGFLVPFLYCFFAFALIFIVGDLFENLDGFILRKVSWAIVCRYYTFLIPSIFVLTTPLAVLLSILYQLGYMSRHNELVALKASGVSFVRVIIPFLAVGILFSSFLFMVNEKLVPRCSKGIDYIRNTYLTKNTDQISQNKDDKDANEKITYFSSLYNLSFYIDTMSKDRRTAEGVSIREFDKDGILIREWYGEKAVWLDSSWWLFNGYIRNFLPGGENGGRMHFFKKQEAPINIQPQDLLRSQKDIGVLSNYMNFKELYYYIKRNFTISTIPRELLVELYKKLSIPFTMFIVTIFGVTFGGRISKGGALSSVGYSLGLYLAYYGLSSFLIAMGKLGTIVPFLAVWTPHVLFGTISVYLLRRTR